MNFREFLNETRDDKLIFVEDELWITYGQGSGTTYYMPDIKKFITNKQGDKNYDYMAEKLAKWSKSNKPVKAKANSKLYEVPIYPHVPMGTRYDIWGGDVTPNGKIYMIIDDNDSIVVVNFFKTKKEAMGWINSLS